MTLEEVTLQLKKLLRVKKITKKQYENFSRILDQIFNSEVAGTPLSLTGQRLGAYSAQKVRVYADEHASEPYIGSQQNKPKTSAGEQNSKTLPNDSKYNSCWNGFLGKIICGNTTHTAIPTGTSQKARLFALLQDGQWHSTPEIQQKIYGGSHLGISRISARIYDIQKDGYEIESRKKTGTIWEYKIK